MPRSDDKFVAQFRRWIVTKLKESTWWQFQGESRDAVAKRLGLRPELLLEAQLSLERDCRRDGRAPVRLGTSNMSPLGQWGTEHRVEIVLPRLVYEEWEAYCQTRQVASGVLLRSLIHRMLMLRELPEVSRGKDWVLRGQRLAICLDRKGGNGAYVTRLVAKITAGAKQALLRRARKCGISVSALIRGCIVELLEGRVPKLVLVGSIREMWDDPNRYWTEV